MMEPAIMLCFDENAKHKCKSLTLIQDAPLNQMEKSLFDVVFDVESLPLPKHSHYSASFGNLQGFPIILGGCGETSCHNRLELFDFISRKWLYGSNYQLSNT